MYKTNIFFFMGLKSIIKITRLKCNPMIHRFLVRNVASLGSRMILPEIV